MNVFSEPLKPWVHAVLSCQEPKELLYLPLGDLRPKVENAFKMTPGHVLSEPNPLKEKMLPVWGTIEEELKTYTENELINEIRTVYNTLSRFVLCEINVTPLLFLFGVLYKYDMAHDFYYNPLLTINTSQLAPVRATFEELRKCIEYFEPDEISYGGGVMEKETRPDPSLVEYILYIELEPWVEAVLKCEMKRDLIQLPLPNFIKDSLPSFDNPVTEIAITDGVTNYFQEVTPEKFVCDVVTIHNRLAETITREFDITLLLYLYSFGYQSLTKGEFDTVTSETMIRRTGFKHCPHLTTQFNSIRSAWGAFKDIKNSIEFSFPDLLDDFNDFYQQHFNIERKLLEMEDGAAAVAILKCDDIHHLPLRHIMGSGFEASESQIAKTKMGDDLFLRTAHYWLDETNNPKYIMSDIKNWYATIFEYVTDPVDVTQFICLYVACYECLDPNETIFHEFRQHTELTIDYAKLAPMKETLLRLVKHCTNDNTKEFFGGIVSSLESPL